MILLIAAFLSLAHAEDDYTANARASFRSDPVGYCKAYEDKGKIKAVEYCSEAMTDGCIVYLEECAKLKLI